MEVLTVENEMRRVKIDGIEFPYLIDKCGNIYSDYTKRLLTPVLGNNGYMKVTLRHNKKSYTPSIHRIVAEAFIPNPNNLPIVNHIDCDKTNNHVDNLEWCTQQYNTIHAYSNGRYRTALTEEQVVEICEKIVNGVNTSTLMKEYGVTKDVIKHIRKKQTWVRITSNYDFPEITYKYTNKKVKEDIRKLLTIDFNMNKGLICRRVGLPHNGSTENIIKRIKKKMREEGSTTIEKEYMFFDIILK